MVIPSQWCNFLSLTFRSSSSTVKSFIDFLCFPVRTPVRLLSRKICSRFWGSTLIWTVQTPYRSSGNGEFVSFHLPPFSFSTLVFLLSQLLVERLPESPVVVQKTKREIYLPFGILVKLVSTQCQTEFQSVLVRPTTQLLFDIPWFIPSFFWWILIRFYYIRTLLSSNVILSSSSLLLFIRLGLI